MTQPHPDLVRDTTYCTILAANYLPKALALAESLERHQPGSRLVVLLIDARTAADLPRLPAGVARGVELATTEVLGIPEREVLRLATVYDLVEFATSVKPLLFRRLLERSPQVVYLDPDTYLTSSLEELPAAVAASEGGIVLTPHFLEPLPPGAEVSDGHLLSVGFYNLGFCAFDRRSLPFQDWWWGHLRTQCLHDPIAGLFVDQKWVDVGGPLFGAAPLRHRGYNVGVTNLHERPVVADGEGYAIADSQDRLRLFHFHAFDPSRPEELSVRFGGSTAHLRQENAALDGLCKEYADAVVSYQRALPDPPAYRYDRDTRGRRIARQTRRAYLTLAEHPGARLPSPFLPEEADAYAAWRRSARTQVARNVLGEAAKSVRCTFPDEFGSFKRRFPAFTERFRKGFVGGTGIWG